MAAEAIVTIIECPDYAETGDEFQIVCKAKNTGDTTCCLQIKLYDANTNELIHAYPNYCGIPPDRNSWPPASPIVKMPNRNWNLIAKVYVDYNTEPEDGTLTKTIVHGTLATCTNYFFAEDQDGNALSENIRASIYKYTADGWVLVGDAWIAPRSGDHLTLTENNSYKAVPITDISGYTTPNEQVWTACSKDITFVYKRICPDPTVSITLVSNRNPESGEVVNFTGYASGGTGHSIVSRKWDFGDGTSSTLSNPSKSWKNTTGSPKSYTVVFTATNDCGKSGSSSTTITVASEVVKTGIEIQFPASLDGKQLIAHGAISTILDLWWTGPAVHGGLWTKGRVTWDNIDSSKKYVIQTGDACETSLPRESPDSCAGFFDDGDYVVILVRNPGFDFRVYGSNTIYPLSGTSFNVLYLDETSGDIITTAFTGRICALAEIPSGAECDAFWAEFYDPIFVANYMEIQATGKDMFGNERDLGWLDHVAFVASLVGSLPAFNLFPFAGITKNLGEAIIVIARKTADLAGDELAKAGGAMADICMNAPKAIGDLVQSELDEVRAALVKVYGDVQGNKYVDDALAVARPFVKKYYDILEDFRTGVADLPDDAVGTILSHGQETPMEVLDLIAEFENKGTINSLCTKLALEANDYPIGSTFRTLSSKRGLIDEATLPKFTKNHCNVAEKATAAADPIKTMEIPETAQEFPFEFRPIADEVGEPISTNLNEVIEKFAESDTGEWKHKGMRYLDGKVLGWFAKITTKKQKKIHFPDAPGRYAKWKNIFDNLEDYQKFTFYTMLAWAIYETTSWIGTFVIPKWFGFFPEQAAFRQRQHNDNMEAASWICKSAYDYGRTDILENGIGLLRSSIAEAEEHLENNKTEFETGDVYAGFAQAITIAKAQLELAEGWLGEATPVGFIKCTSNEDFFYVELDGSPAGFSYKSKSILLKSVKVGTRTVKIYKHLIGECEKNITVTEGATPEFDCQMVGECPEVTQVKISASPSMVKVGETVTFIATVTSERPITHVEFDFGNGVKKTPPGGATTIKYAYPKAGTWQASATAYNDCGKYAITYSLAKVIVREEEAPPTPTPGEEAATIDVKTPIDARTGAAIVFPVKPYIFVDGKSIDKTAPYPIPFGGFGELPVKDPTTVTVKAAGYQDKSETFHLTDKYFESWVPYMDPVGYVPPVGHPIDFYIPENASLTVTPITTVSRIVAGMKRIGGR